MRLPGLAGTAAPCDDAVNGAGGWIMRNDWPAVIGLLVLGGIALPAAAETPPAKAPALEAFAEGVQIYGCTETNGAFAWMLKGPEASLHDAKGAVIGKHFAGPTWQATDGSKVVGELVQSTPAPQPGAVAWLLLHAKSHDGPGAMADVAYIVRTHTKGGAAPSTGCDAAHADAESRVLYSATYLFFRG